MTKTQLRMWREWTDDHGSRYASESFEDWQMAMRPHRFELLEMWSKALRELLDRCPDQVPHGQLHVLHEQAETLRTLDSGTPWEVPFNRMRAAFLARDMTDLRRLAKEMTEP